MIWYYGKKLWNYEKKKLVLSIKIWYYTENYITLIYYRKNYGTIKIIVKYSKL